MSQANITVATLGSGTMATAVATLVARGGGRVLIWARDETHADWAVEDVSDDAPTAVGQVSVCASLRAALSAADVVVPALPWGPVLGEVLTPVADLLHDRLVVDVCNPYEMTALGPKLAMVVPGGSAAAYLAGVLPEGTMHAHMFTQVRADRLNNIRPGDNLVLPWVLAPSNISSAVLADFLHVLSATGWLPVHLGDLGKASLIEEGGPWAAAHGAAGLGRLTYAEAMAQGLLEHADKDL